MKVLVVGGGGREHALCWKIARSPLVDRVYCAPGNGGIEDVAECVDIAVTERDALRNFAKENGIGLTVVGPEDPLCAGIADEFAAAGLLVFGPTKAGAEIEGSKAFAREICRRHRIPSPGFWVFDDMAQANAFLENREDGPIVVKASGLAAGKGVTVAADFKEARAAIRECLDQSRFGDAGRTVVLEEKLSGPEVSIMTLTDGSTIVPFEPARDHKPVGDDDTGPMTGGMGVVTPVKIGSRLMAQIENQVLFPAIHAMNREGRPYRGFLYSGLMLTAAGPRVLEFNCRLGDPETQPLLMRLKSDLVPLLLATAEGRLEELDAPEWDTRPAVCVMAVSGGYPGDYKKGLPIHGLDAIEASDTLQVFHSGTRRSAGRGANVVTSGGRVLSVCALGDTVEGARQAAYREIAKIDFAGMHYRKDIGARP